MELRFTQGTFTPLNEPLRMNHSSAQDGDNTVIPVASPALVITLIGDDILIYDHSTAEAHHLNEAASQVWAHCDGQTTVAQASSTLEGGREQVLQAVKIFEEKKLLSSPIPKTKRRDVVKGLVKAAIFMPIVNSVITPTPAAAASGGCAPACVTNTPGCSGCGVPVVSPRSAMSCSFACGNAAAPCPSNVVCMARFTKGASGSCATDVFVDRICFTTFTGPGSGTNCASARSTTSTGDTYLCCSNCT